jgi:predicted O-linked N-acetylglucosamine transferase (SPINDLY family)
MTSLGATATAPSRTDPALNQQRAADSLRTQQRWSDALALYQPLLKAQPRQATVAHNIAVCHMGLHQNRAAEQHALQALSLNPLLWQSGLIAAKAQHLQGQGIQALQTLYSLQLNHPQQAPIALEIARRTLHTLCHPCASAQAVQHLLQHPQHGAQARQMQLLSQLYDRPKHISSVQLNTQLVQHAQRQLTAQAPGPTPAPAHPPTSAQTQPIPQRPRLGIISNQLHSSPVYYLAIGALRHIAQHADITVFNRSARSDWATQHFQAIASHWVNLTQHNAQTLSTALHQHPVHSLIDLCGWMDTATLQALTTQPAPRQYKWVGGQSATTGLHCFNGFISDEHHTPPGSQSLYTEPLLCIPGGYASYTPPPYMPAPQSPPRRGVHIGIIANPAKLSHCYLSYLRQHWATWQQRSPVPLQLHLIDKRYQLAPLKQRIQEQLSGLPLQFHTPATHLDYLSAIGQLHAVLDTWPYSGGLTTLEAHALGVPVFTRSNGQLFSERHSHAHNQYLGLDIPTIDHPDFTPAHALQINREELRNAALKRQNHKILGELIMNEILN